MKRRLTTIFCADAVRYSAQMAADEDATLDRLRRYRAIMNTQFDRHEGRQVNAWGDAIIAEFSSVVLAMRCAIEIQDAIGVENETLTPHQKMLFRIGINLGDVMIDEGDLYGDGVNVAARLESLADPGGILVSGTVYELSRKQLSTAFEFTGDKDIKNVDEPVPIYRVRLEDRHERASDASSTDDVSGAPAAGDKSIFSQIAGKAEYVMSWLKDQPRGVRNSAALIVLFAALNILFGGVAEPWFILPAAPFAAYIYLHILRERKRRQSNDPYLSITDNSEQDGGSEGSDQNLDTKCRRKARLINR